MSLQNDLDELLQAGIISSDTAAEITRYYQSKKENTGSRFNSLLGILGALLVSAGIVLVVAHNWDDLGPGMRTFFAFLPMVIGQGLCAYTLLKRKDSRLWRECSSVVLFFAMMAAISLISQIYQISGSLEGLLFTWLLVTAPIVYVMNSSVTSLLVIAVATWYGFLVGYDFSDRSQIAWYYFGFLLFIAPHYYWYARYNRPSIFFHFHNLFLAASLIINLGMFATATSGDWGSALYLALFSFYYLLGNTNFFRKLPLAGNIFLLFGLLGTIILLMAWSFQVFWIDVNRHRIYPGFGPAQIVVIWLSLLSLVLVVKHYRDGFKFDPVGFSVFVYLFCILANNAYLSPLMINLWTLLLGVFFIRKGSLQNHLGILNLGLLIILLLAVLRFFDDNIPFIYRGLLFVAAGAGFFAANYLMLRKRKAVTQNNNP